MKKYYYIVVIILLVTISIIILNKSTSNLNINIDNKYGDTQEYIIGEYGESGEYERTKKAIKEVMNAYYLRGSYYQYNYPKAFYYEKTPENATSQDISYSVCASFVSDIYAEAFGVLKSTSSKSPDGFPQTVSLHAAKAASYYKEIKEGTKADDGTFLLYYSTKQLDKEASSSGSIDEIEDDEFATEIGEEEEEIDKEAQTVSSSLADSTRYIYNYKGLDEYNYDELNDYTAFVSTLQPGDVIGYTKHVLIVYDLIKDNNGNVVDALLLNSSVQPYIRSRLADSNEIGYIKLKSKYPNSFFTDDKYNISSDTLDVENEGTFKRRLLSNVTYLVKEIDGQKKLTCYNTDECFIMRPYYNKNGKVVFNFPIKEEDYNRSKLRSSYSGLFIEKTVNIGDRNSIYLNDELEYKIVIKNNGNETYGAFNIEEYFDIDYVELIEKNDGTVSSNGVISWERKSLESGETIELKYKVKVKNIIENVNKIVVETGKFYGNNKDVYIETGTIENKIIPSVTVSKVSYQSCFEQLKNDYEKLELIDKIYECARGKNVFGNDFSFIDFRFDIKKDDTNTDLSRRLFVTKNRISSRATSDALVLNNNADSLYQRYINMILNNYWGGIRLYGIKSGSSNATYMLDYGSDTKVLEGDEKYTIPRWAGDNSKLRARNINSIDFKDGDVLIYDFMPCDTSASKNCVKNYTKERRLYAYIYIDGKFVGHNADSSNTTRNEYTYQYYNDIGQLNYLFENTDKGLIYLNAQLGSGEITKEEYDDFLEYVNYQALFGKDNYVILRPELIIKEHVIGITSMPSKLQYNYNETIDTNHYLDGLELKMAYNNGEELEDINIDDISVSGFDTTSSGRKTITIEYQNLKTTFEINVLPDERIKIIDDNTAMNGNEIDIKIPYDYILTVSELKKKIELVGNNITIKNASGNTVQDNNEVLGTGSKIILNKSEYTIVISGDINKDGKITALDYIAVRNHMMKERIIDNTSIEYKAADMNKDGNISVLDYINIRKIMMGES